MGGYLKKSPLENSLKELVVFRISQLNKCAYCIDMHYKDARAAGETEQRLYGLSAWQESSYYTERERAAFAWAEAVEKGEMPDAVHTEARKHFSDEELIDLTMIVTNVRTWNRINLVFANEPGSYRVGQFG